MEDSESASLLMSLRRGSKMDPWGTPENAWNGEELEPEIVTLFVRAVR